MARANTKTQGARKQTAATKKAVPKVVIDKGLHTRWEEAFSRYQAARTNEAADFDARYEALGEILDGQPPYYLAGGFKTATEFLAKTEPGEDERTVRQKIRVAQYFDPSDEEKHGYSKLDALLSYLEAVGGAPLPPAKLHVERQKVKVTRGKTTRALPFPDVTRDEISVATRVAKGQAGKAAPRQPPLVKALRAVLAKAKLSRIGVRLRDGKVDLTGIAPEHLAALGKALAKADLGDT